MDTQEKTAKKMAWWTLALMAFSTVWGFGNVVNGYIYFGGVKVIFSWVLMFILYFVPYALMVGELGSVFKESEGGVSSWVNATMGPKIAYYAGWTYWACHVAYISSKGTGGLRALAWAIFQDITEFDHANTMMIQLITFVIFVFFCWLASRGLSVLKTLATIAGSTMFIMSLLYILMMIAAPAINPHGMLPLDLSFKKLIPTFNVNYFTSLSILVFAVGECEKISPYVNKMQNPSKDFPKGMFALAIMVMVCAILGTIAMGMMFDVRDVNAHFNDYVSNGAYTNGIWMVGILSGAIILIQSVVPGATAVMAQLVKLNATTMPLRYLWVFAAYIALRGGWCFAITAACCLLGIYSPDPFTLALNILTPIALTGLGLILPWIKKREQV